MKVIPSKPELRKAEFEQISRTIYGMCGIRLTEAKIELVRSRLGKRLQVLNLPDFADYLQHLENDSTGQEISNFVDALTTNKTSFFREQQHFDFLRKSVLPAVNSQSLRIWSAACSSGEEPYSIAILLNEALPDIERRDARILATDISAEILARARAGIYSAENLQCVPPEMRRKYFEPHKSDASKSAVSEKIKKIISFARLNLMSEWQMRGQFDVIFCRNVMIYFDKPTQTRLVNRLGERLAPGGYLFVGHAESLTGVAHGLKYIQPAIYQK